MEKILAVVPLPPPHHGSNVMNQHVVNCLELSGKYDVKVLPLHYAVDIADMGKVHIKKIIALVGYLFRDLMLLITFRPDAVYFVPAVTGFSFYRDCLFTLLFKCFRVHVIYHLHGKGIRHKITFPILAKLCGWFFRSATVIHLSPLLYVDIKDVVSYDQCRFLPNGIEDLRSGLFTNTKPDIRETSILFVSNLHLSKGPIVLLEACKILMDNNLLFKTYFVGNPSASLSGQSFSDAINGMGLCNHVEYLGPKYDREKHEIFMKSDILAFPTERDAFPLVLLEAMAAGMPVVSTREGAIPEIIDDGINGFIIDKRNPEQLAEKLEYLIANPGQRKKMGQAGRMKFEQNYTIEKFCKNLINVFDDILIAS